MHSLPQEFLALCRQLGDAQQRCSAAIAAQAAQIDALNAEVVRLRGAVVLRDTRLALAREELQELRAAQPGLPRRLAMARHIGMLAERITALSRECLRWRQAAAAEGRAGAAQSGGNMALRPQSSTAGAPCTPSLPAPAPAAPLAPLAPLAPPLREAASRAGQAVEPFRAIQVIQAIDVTGIAQDLALDASLAAADLVICQTGCISHDQYWRVQDHCRRTGKPCILVDRPLAARQAEVLAAMEPTVVLCVATEVPAIADAAPGVARGHTQNTA